MRAVSISAYGGPEVLQVRDIPIPDIQADEVLIRVLAAGINPVDWRIRSGQLHEFIPCDFPAILGREVAGIVERCGAAVTDLAPGDEVYSFLQQGRMKWGGYAEFVPIAASKVAHKPRTLSFTEAAAIPLAGTTAWQCITGVGNLQPGEVLFVHAAAGGVGGYAVQIGKYLGATVAGTASAGNHAYLRELGIDLAIDYRHEDFVAVTRQHYPDGVDVVLASLTGPPLLRSAEIIKPSGKLPLIAPTMDPRELNLKPVAPHPHMAQSNTRDLRALASLADQGKLRVEVSQVLPLEKAAEAHRISETGHVRGKLVLDLQA